VSQSMSPSKNACIVFLVLSETSVRDFIENRLHEHGALVFSTSTTASARQFLNAYQGDLHLIIVEHHLPGGDGLELAAAIARARPNARVVLMTEAASRHYLHDWHGRILTKPLDAEALRVQLAQALDAIPCEMASPKVRASEAGL